MANHIEFLDHSLLVNLTLGNLSVDSIWDDRATWLARGVTGMSRLVYYLLAAQGPFAHDEKKIITRLACETHELFVFEWCTKMKAAVTGRLANEENYILYGEFAARENVGDLGCVPYCREILYRSRLSDVIKAHEVMPMPHTVAKLDTTETFGMRWPHSSLFGSAMDRPHVFKYIPEVMALDLTKYILEHASQEIIKNIPTFGAFQGKVFLAMMFLREKRLGDPLIIYNLLAGYPSTTYTAETRELAGWFYQTYFEKILKTQSGENFLVNPHISPDEIAQDILDYISRHPERREDILYDLSGGLEGLEEDIDLPSGRIFGISDEIFRRLFLPDPRESQLPTQKLENLFALAILRGHSSKKPILVQEIYRRYSSDSTR